MNLIVTTPAYRAMLLEIATNMALGLQWDVHTENLGVGGYRVTLKERR